MKKNKAAIIFTILLVTTASIDCASATPGQATGATQDSLLQKYKYPVYARLDNQGNKYRFVDFSAEPEDGSINLLDLTPTYSQDTLNASTSFFVAPKIEDADCRHTNQPATDKTKFRKFHPKVARTAGYWVFSAGILLVLGDISGDSVFDHNSYNSAIAEACSDPSFDREKLLSEYSILMSSEDKARQAYENKKLSPELRVIDKSGLYDNSIITTEFIESSIQITKTPFNSKISNLAQLGTYQTYTDFITAVKLKLQEWAANPTCTFFIEHNKYNKICDYNMSITTPSQITWQDNSNNKLPILVEIFSKDINNVSPQYCNYDKNIKLSNYGNSLTIENNSKQYITIKSISLYCEDQIYTSINSTELPPLSTKTYALDELLWEFKDRIHSSRKYPGATKVSTQNTYINWGFAIKYDIVGTGKSTTLYSQKKYRLYDLIK